MTAQLSTLLPTPLALAAILVLACARDDSASRADSIASTSSTVSDSGAVAVLTGSDTASCKTGGMTDYRKEYPIPVLDAPNGKVLYEFHNDSTREDIYGLDIGGYADGFLLVEPWSVENKLRRGWVDSKYVWVLGRNYDRPLTLYTEPREDSPPKAIVRDWWNGLYAVLRCRGEWLDVRATIEGKVYEGWMSKDLQCDNPFTTCS